MQLPRLQIPWCASSGRTWLCTSIPAKSLRFTSLGHVSASKPITGQGVECADLWHLGAPALEPWRRLVSGTLGTPKQQRCWGAEGKTLESRRPTHLHFEARLHTPWGQVSFPCGELRWVQECKPFRVGSAPEHCYQWGSFPSGQRCWSHPPLLFCRELE